ncbi:MAG TPA: PAS domain-containing sensor histidine kinase [Ignavibacteriales bacterium]|nr:PAS domain-containing sensor histidine kinase [Ignavibacteriales bacterium]
MIKENILPTKYAPAGRSSLQEIEEQKELLKYNRSIPDVLNLIPEMTLILNSSRQVLFANNAFLERLGIQSQTEITGKRFGEIIDCHHASETGGGCGTMESCMFCGGVNAILCSQKTDTEIKEECRILRKDTLEALDFRITASPLNIGPQKFTLFSVKDISHEKRRSMLERIFFHDVLNTAGNIYGFTELLESASDEEVQSYRNMLSGLSKKLIEEIESQRILTQVENNELAVNLSQLNSLKVIADVADSYKLFAQAASCRIIIDANSESIEFRSDKVLLRRVLGNMLKNALEATPKNGTVTIGCLAEEEKLEFRVHNQTNMPKDVQLQIFLRSYSTKGTGRGLGTYSMKLIGEKYLNGKVNFFSDTEKGTTFFITLPLNN